MCLCMHVYPCVHMHICKQMKMSECACVHACVHVFVCVHACIIHMYVCMSIVYFDAVFMVTAEDTITDIP